MGTQRESKSMFLQNSGEAQDLGLGAEEKGTYLYSVYDVFKLLFSHGTELPEARHLSSHSCIPKRAQVGRVPLC